MDMSYNGERICVVDSIFVSVYDGVLHEFTLRGGGEKPVISDFLLYVLQAISAFMLLSFGSGVLGYTKVLE